MTPPRRARSVRLLALEAAIILACVALAPAIAGAQPRHFTCYRAKATSGSERFVARDVTAVDQFRTSTLTVRRPQLLCAPTNKNGEDPSAPAAIDHLEDYKIKSAVRFAPTYRQSSSKPSSLKAY